jgi:hypothetical protein
LSVGKVIKKEAWEIEVKRKSGLRNDNVESPGDDQGLFGLGFGSGSKAQQARKVGSVTTKTNLHTSSSPEPSLVIQKEQWEIDAEAGLHTAAGRRRAEIAAAVAEEASIQARHTANVETAAKTGASLDKYYNASHSSLILPSALPVTRRILPTHGRAMSVGTTGPSLVSDPLVPMQTLPLPLIESHPWSTTLRVLELSNRRSDVCFLLSGAVDICLPRLEELKLDGCNLGDVVRLVSSTEGETQERLIITVRRLFPNVRSLDLSYNLLTTLHGVEEYFLPPATPAGPVSGLKVLRARGNKIGTEGLEALVSVGKRLQGASSGLDGWRGEEVDLRENEIAKVRGR